MEFSQKVKDLSGSTIKILGEPFGIYEKLAAFQYARESSKGIEKGVTLLRFEDGKVLLQVDLPAHDDPGKVAYVENLDLQELLRIWNEADRSAAEREYEANAVVLSDEDLMEASWRDHQVPPTLQTLLYQFKGWNPEVIGEPIRVGDTLLFSWRWFDKDYPVGYGIRAIQAGESGITRDIRMVIRPWETSSTFMVP
jgi:hypothetical protein